MNGIISYLKFLAKRAVSAFRSLLVLLFGRRVCTSGWENRMLIINLEALGDLVVFTSVLKHYKKRFPEKKIYLLAKSGLGVEGIFKGTFADEIKTLDYRKFSVNPFYGVSVIRDLRNIGFQTVINHDFSAAEINGKWIAVRVGAKEVIGYEGIGAEFTQPFDVHQKKNLRVVMDKIYPRFTRIIPSIDATVGHVKEFPSALRHYIAIYEGATGFVENDYSTFLPLPKGSAVSVFDPKLEKGKYAILGITASVSYKRWPLDRFAEIARFFKQRNMKVVITGSPREKFLADRFELMLKGQIENKIGQTSLDQLLALVKSAACVVTNDTSLVHFAVALGTPSVCITGGGQFGMFSNYGYADTHRWIYKKASCFGDNWRCGKGLLPDTPSPCIAEIGVQEVVKEVEAVLAASQKAVSGAKEFRLGSIGEAVLRSGLPATMRREQAGRRENAKIKVVYAGVQAENYNPKRIPSFEYSNFYLTLKNMEGVSVVEYPYDPIVGMGKRRFNEKLLEFIRKEKPDMFFAFMLSDELDPTVLDEIKKYTASVAWFADDYWRFWNYSRHFAPHFHSVVTTYSKAAEWYRAAGVTNVVRSQWACNAGVYKPRDVKKDIDVSFVGQWKPQREQSIQALALAGIQVRTYGFGWPNGKIPQDEIPSIFSRSKISLNLSERPSRFSPQVFGRLFFKRSIDRIVPDFHLMDNFRAWRDFAIPHTHARPFELAGCRAFVISGRSADLGECYAEGKEIIFYDSEVDLIEKVRHYLVHDDEREKIAAAGYERTIREHTYEKRFRDLFKVMDFGS